MTTEQPYYGNYSLCYNTEVRWALWISARRAQDFTRFAILTAVAVTLFIFFL